MRWKPVLGVALAILVIGVVQAISLPSASVRYRVAVSLDFDGKPVSGSTVLEWDGKALSKGMEPDAPDLDGTVYGDAIPIPLSGTQTLFVLHREDGLPFDKGSGDYILNCVNRYRHTGPETVELVRQFRGECDSAGRPAVALYSQFSSGHDLQLIEFGGGTGHTVVHLRVHVQWTDEPVTRGIADKYPWINSLPMTDPIGSPGAIIPEGEGMFSTNRLYKVDFAME